ncbi:Importin subunit alpha [Trachymyrmex septentrionalis]|uniref:Importin subunit alpha n=1 Tax=Trachymyrmex septentrionalis TaxID=34720 RepID=A0A195F5U6_9HYME|nr:Importin subunit alpha [Trachymyrmex septentrionalis]
MYFQENYDDIVAINFEINMIDEEMLRIKWEEMELCKTIKEVRLTKRNFDIEQELFDLMYKTSPDFDLTELDEIADNINSSDETLQLIGIQTYRKLGRQRKTVNNMLFGDILSRCIEFLDSDNICLQCEVISLLTVITLNGSEESKNRKKYEAIPKLLKLLKSASSIVEQIVYVLGNIIDIPYARDLALEYDAISLVVDLIKPDTSVTFMDNISWLLSNLCQRSPPLSLELIRPVLPVFDRLLSSENNNIISDTCRILYYLTNGVNNNIQAIMETGILPKILNCLISKMKSILIPAWLTVRNIAVMGDNTQRDAIILAGGLSRLRSLYWYYGDKKNIIAEQIMWLICKMARDTDQIQSVIDAGLLLTLINEILFGETKVIAIWAVTTMMTRATDQQFTQFINAGIVPALCNLLPSNDQTNITVLTGLTKILHAAEKRKLLKNFVIMIKTIGGLDKIETLQHHKNEKVYKKSLNIIDTFFSRKTKPKFPNLMTEAVVPSFLSDGTMQSQTQSSDKVQILAIHIYSELFNLKKNLSASDTLEDDVLPCCIELLDSDNFVVQFELITLLTAVTSDTFSKEAQYVIKNGLISKLVKLLQSASPKIVEKAMHSLGIIIKDRPYARDLALEENALLSLVNLIKPDTSTGSIYNIVRTLTYLCKRSNSALSLDRIRPILPVFKRLFNNQNIGEELRSNICKMLSYITYGSNHNVRAVLETGILLKIVYCLTLKEKSILIPALQTIKNIVAIDEAAESEASIVANYLPIFYSLLQNHLDEDIIQEIILIIFEMVTNMDQIQNVLDANLLPSLMKIFVVFVSMFKWLLKDLFSRATKQYLTVVLINVEILSDFSTLLNAKDFDNIINALDGLNNICDVAEKVGEREKLVTIMKKVEILDKLKVLQYHRYEIIYEKSMVILSSWFS